MSDSSRHDLYQVPEAAYGVTPANPDFDKVRHTSTSLGLAKETAVSEELRGDRQINCFRHGLKQVGGDIGFELSYGSYDSQLEAVLLGTWDDDAGGAGIDVLKAGVTRRSFSLMRHFTDQVAADKPFHVFNGVEYNTFNITVGPTAIVTGSFTVLGRDLELSTTAPAGSTLGVPSENCPFSGFSGVIREGGAIIGILTEISLTLENGLAVRPVIGDARTIKPQIGRSNLTGQVTAYFENSALLEKFINETASSLEFELADSTHKYVFNLPNIKYNGGQPDTSGQGAISLALPIQALYDADDESNIVITRQAI